MAPPPSFLRPPPFPHRVLRLPTPAAFRLSEVLGGRGLCNGELGILKELSSPTSPSPPMPTTASSPAAAATEDDAADDLPAADNPAAFEKEMMGLTGGFPGGEVGLQDFVAQHPPPPPPRKEPISNSPAVAPAERERRPPPELPLFLPGMVVLVKNPQNAYHMYCGVVQRVTDGKVGVLFEGGNWDRLIAFGVDELEGREKGPPMVNPKSVVLEALVAGVEETEKKAPEMEMEKEGSAAAA